MRSSLVSDPPIVLPSFRPFSFVSLTRLVFFCCSYRSASLIHLTDSIKALTAKVLDPESTPQERLQALREVADFAQRFKLGGEDKIRVVGGVCEGVSAYIPSPFFSALYQEIWLARLNIDAPNAKLTSLPSFPPFRSTLTKPTSTTFSSTPPSSPNALLLHQEDPTSSTFLPQRPPNELEQEPALLSPRPLERRRPGRSPTQMEEDEEEGRRTGRRPSLRTSGTITSRVLGRVGQVGVAVGELEEEEERRRRGELRGFPFVALRCVPSFEHSLTTSVSSLFSLFSLYPRRSNSAPRPASPALSNASHTVSYTHL